MSNGAPGGPEAREDAIREWKQESDDAMRRGRRFSGDRLKRAGRSEWLTKGAFVLGTAVVVLFIVAQGGKGDRARRKEARVAAQIEEPSVRDFRPPVMPVRLDPPAPKVLPELPRPVEKPPVRERDDAEAAAARRKAEQLEEARIKSDILVKAEGAALPALAASVPTVTLGQQQAPNGPPDPNRAFAEQMSGRPAATAFPKRLAGLECVALQGKMIDAELETAIDTDLPGQIRAIVSSPLYAEQGRDALVPVGSRLTGIYNSAVRKGQVRVFAIWNRLVRPDGVEIALDSAVTDALGRAGLLGETDNHFGQIFGMSILLSVIGTGAGTAGVSPDARYNSADAYRHDIQQSFARTADRVLEPYAGIPPTNTVAQGERIKVFLNRDLDFCGLRAAASRERTEIVLP